MFSRFITRQYRYAVKQLASGAARVYIQNKDALRASGLLANSNIRVVNKRNRIEVHLDKHGDKKVMDTGRGELLELKNRDTARALGNAKFVSVTFRTGKVIIQVHGLDEAQQRREQRVIDCLRQGKPLRKACFFSGLGMLSYHLSQGLARQGLETEISFANDHEELAMTCNLGGNPMWDHASEDAVALVDDLHAIDPASLPQADIATVGYPCVGFSDLAKVENRDTKHPTCGTLFIPLVASLKAMNPAMIVFENTPRFGISDTLSLLKRSLPGYSFRQTVVDGHDFNEIESRKRVCVVATSDGLPAFDPATVTSLFDDFPRRQIKSVLSNVPANASCWAEMAHVKARDNMPHLGFKNCLYTGEETEMVTLPASYGPRKAGAPMIAHPDNVDLQRQIQPDEHARLREIPLKLAQYIMAVWSGALPQVSKKGSMTAAHRLLGNGVSRRIWESMGAAMGLHLISIAHAEA